MSSQALNEPLSPEMNEQLRMEIGWSEVGRGLGQILLGIFFHFIGAVAGVGLIMVALYGLPNDSGVRTRAPGTGSLWLLYSGLATLVLINLLGYLTVASGQFRCMMSSSERQGARWLMFFCIACMFIGPAFNIAAAIAGSQRAFDINNTKTFTEIHYTQTGQYLKLVGFGLGLLYPLFFLLFLRATAICMHARFHVMVLNLFLMYAIAVVGCTAYLLYDPRYALPQGLPVMALGFGWLGLILGYLTLIGVMRFCVLRTMERVRSPLDY